MFPFEGHRKSENYNLLSTASRFQQSLEKSKFNEGLLLGYIAQLEVFWKRSSIYKNFEC